jgi:glutaredoxin
VGQALRTLLLMALAGVGAVYGYRWLSPHPAPTAEPPVRAVGQPKVARPAPPPPPAPVMEIRTEGERPLLRIIGEASTPDGGADPAALATAQRLRELDERMRINDEGAKAARDFATRGRATSPGTLTMYSAKWCGPCKRAKTWLAEKNIPYVDRDVDASVENKRAHQALNPRGSLPTFDVKGQVLVGWNQGSLEQALAR